MNIYLLRADAFCPDIVLGSAGFDGHASAPLASMKMSAAGFRRVTEVAVDIANRHCDGRIALFLEGGYDLGGLTDSVAQCIDALDDVW